MLKYEEKKFIRLGIYLEKNICIVTLISIKLQCMTVRMQSMPAPRNLKPKVGNMSLHPKQTA